VRCISIQRETLNQAIILLAVLVVVSDSYMGMFLPVDISCRITQFMAGKIEFPFINKDELTATFYIFGKDYGVKGQIEKLTANDLAKKAIQQLSKDIRIFYNMPNKLDSNFIRENYIRRSLQISIELQKDSSYALSEMNKRIAGDPTILSSCFAQHIAYYKQDYFFELFQPFEKNQFPSLLTTKLEGRMLLIGFNAKDSKSLPFQNSLVHFIRWIINNR
jgi:hypothetical protein